MALNLDRRSLLLTASGAAALPLLGLGSRVAFGADGEITVRIEKDISNLDPANRVGSVASNRARPWSGSPTPPRPSRR
jgi:hypothetical protein